jgi:hypothetical protein
MRSISRTNGRMPSTAIKRAWPNTVVRAVISRLDARAGQSLLVCQKRKHFRSQRPSHNVCASSGVSDVAASGLNELLAVAARVSAAAQQLMGVKSDHVQRSLLLAKSICPCRAPAADESDV